MPRKKQPRNRGQIQSRGHNKWLARVFLGTDDSGKRRYSSKTVKGSKREAEKVLTEMLHEVDSGAFVEPSKTTLKDFLEGYLDGKKDCSASTIAHYRSSVRNNVYPFIGGLRLEQLTPMRISKLYNKELFEEKGLNPRTIQYAHQVLSSALKQAVIWGMIPKNPCDNVKKPTKQAKHHSEVRALTTEQVHLLLESTKDTRWGPLWNLLLSTGMRPQEACGLKWSDFDEPSLYIRRAVKLAGATGYEVGPTKTKSSRRSIHLPGSTIKALREHRRRQAEEVLAAGKEYDREGDWIFANKTGGFTPPYYIRRRWKKLMKDLGFPDYQLYDCRHTHATMLLMLGEHPKVVSERLGHSKVAITMDVYSSVIPSMQEGAAATMDRVLGVG